MEEPEICDRVPRTEGMIGTDPMARGQAGNDLMGSVAADRAREDLGRADRAREDLGRDGQAKEDLGRVGRAKEDPDRAGRAKEDPDRDGQAREDRVVDRAREADSDRILSQRLRKREKVRVRRFSVPRRNPRSRGIEEKNMLRRCSRLRRSLK